MTDKERLSFEEALKKLEDIVAKLESDEITLDKSIQLYEEGIKLSRYCTKKLEEAEQRIEKVNIDQRQSSNNNED